jgi:hypothetical protein
MNTYTCPMHPEIIQNKPGDCPKCGMRLVLKTQEKSKENPYMPLIVVVGLIFLVTLTISFKDFQQNSFSIFNMISYFMTGFFLTFAGFKLMDLKGFAEGYHTYDLLAQKWYNYGYMYPFIELFFGLAMILYPHQPMILWAEIAIMTFSGIGVAMKLAKKEKFQCACLGTFLKVPLTKITIIEDFGMALLALVLLFS